jgi:hypothetical protein
MLTINKHYSAIFNNNTNKFSDFINCRINKISLKVEVYLSMDLLTEEEQTLIFEKKLDVTGLSLSFMQSVETRP